MFDPNELARFPKDPGVYLMKDRKGTILYIGKAKNLRVRIKQYFAAARDERIMVPFLTTQIEEIDTIIVSTEKEALLLENTLIKRHKPKYNVLLKDDKTYVSILLTKHKWPMLKLVRFKGKPPRTGTYFGPYTNARIARQTLDLISKLFPLRQCSDNELINRTRPCLLYDIKRCIAPCMPLCTQTEYQSHVQSAKRLLKGQDKDLLRELKAQMKKASEDLEFEKADSLLQMIRQIEHVTHIQHVDNPAAKHCDTLGLFRKADSVLIVQLIFREGKLIASEHFTFTQIASLNHEILESFILQHYRGQEKPPHEILTPISLPQKALLSQILSEHSRHKVQIQSPLKGKKKELIQMAEKNAKALFERHEDTMSLTEKMLLDLQETLHLTRFPRRIECFDTSNIFRTDPVAALVAFTNGERDKDRTRFFKVKSKGDDYSALREVIHRHFTRQKEKNDFCDLLIIDGGKGQLNIALDIFKELNIASVDAIGVAKQKGLHTKGLTQERIFVPHEKDPISISSRSPLLFLLQKIRDESHRLAIGFHRKRRSKRTITTALDSLEGIGPTKRKRLLQHFKSFKRITEATRSELEKIKGLTKKDIDLLLSLKKQP